MIRGLPAITPFARGNVLARPPIYQSIRRRFTKKVDNKLIDSVANRDADVLLPVARFLGDGSVVLVKTLDEHLYPYVDEEYKLFAKKEDLVCKVESGDNTTPGDIVLKELGKRLVFDSSVTNVLSLEFTGKKGDVTYWNWGDGKCTHIHHTGAPMTMNHHYEENSGVYYIFGIENNIFKLCSRNYTPGIRGELGVDCASVKALSLRNCTQMEGDLSSLSDVSDTVELNNCKKISGSLKDIYKGIRSLVLDYCSLVSGDLSDVSGVLFFLSLDFCVNITGDLSSLPELEDTLSLYKCPKITVNKDIILGVRRAYLGGCNFSQIEIERVVRALDNNGREQGILQLTAANAKPNTETLLLIQNLKEKGWSVTHN